jgi:hypothetical protein
MNTGLTHLRILSDGRPGHENQSFGLAEALQRRTGAAVECVRLDLKSGLVARVGQARALAANASSPQLLIATGHRTHVPLLFAARRFDAKAVVIMKPSLPSWLFDLCLVPQHDLQDGRAPARFFATRGALNRLPETPGLKTETGVILVGGPSKHHDWAGAPLVAAIAEIVRRRPGLTWTVANSRRTPAGFLAEIAALNLPIEIVPHEQTTAGWLPARLMNASEVWVTEDSTSMMFEAVTARARVGLLPLPARRADSRVVRSVNDMVGSDYATRYADWLATGRLAAPAAPLHEAARCADEVLRRFFPFAS